MAKKIIYHRTDKSPDIGAFQREVARLSRDQLIRLKNDLVAERQAIKDELRQISSTGALRGEAREYAKNACLRERDRLGAKIAYVIHLLSRMKRLKKGLRRQSHAAGTTAD